MKFTYALPYGKQSYDLQFETKSTPEVILPSEITPSQPGILIVNNAIRKPLVNYSWSSGIDLNTKAAITINDKTRPVPNNILFPPLLNELERIGVARQNITIIIATGSHTPMNAHEFSLLLSQNILDEYHIVSHNCDDKDNLVYKGTTSLGTAVHVNKIFDQAQLKIVVGDIEPHHFAGFSGGYKSAAIGVCGRSTITQNHAHLLDNRAEVGKFETNPLRQDIEEIGRIIGVDCALNAVLNYKKEVIEVFFGHPTEVIKAGMDLCKKISMSPIDHLYDVVIASAGGYPKDINFYQAQKALTHASLFCKDGGNVILLAECVEGVGNDSYLQFMHGVESHRDAIEKFKLTGFSVGPHKAIQTARILSRVKFHLFSRISTPILEQLLIDPVPEIESNIQKMLQQNPDSRIAIVPYATNTIPLLK
jgi:lactate racemase